jgi:hypothetical protein
MYANYSKHHAKVFEPDTPVSPNLVNDEELYGIDPNVSIAISLRRIADLLESLVDYRFNSPAIRIRGND